MADISLTCELILQHYLAIVLRLSGRDYVVDPKAISGSFIPCDAIIGYLNGPDLCYDRIPLILSYRDDDILIKLYSDSGTESISVKEAEWRVIKETALYQLCHGVLFEGRQTVSSLEERPLQKSFFWKTLFGLAVWDLVPQYQRPFVNDIAGNEFECTLLSKTDDNYQELLFRIGPTEQTFRWCDFDFEGTNLSALRKRLELALNSQVYNIGLPADDYLSCKYFSARKFYYDENNKKWEYSWDSNKALISLGNQWEEDDEVSGVCSPFIVIPILYQRLFEIATRFDMNTNMSSKSYRAQLFSSEIEDHLASIRKWKSE